MGGIPGALRRPVLEAWFLLQCRVPFLSRSTLKPSGIGDGSSLSRWIARASRFSARRVPHGPKERQPSRRHSYAMRKFYLFYGVAALAATMILFMGWLAEREKRAGIDRLERSELHHTSGAGR